LICDLSDRAMFTSPLLSPREKLVLGFYACRPMAVEGRSEAGRGEESGDRGAHRLTQGAVEVDLLWIIGTVPTMAGVPGGENPGFIGLVSSVGSLIDSPRCSWSW
jgi:hypothetical protein